MKMIEYKHDWLLVIATGLAGVAGILMVIDLFLLVK